MPYRPPAPKPGNRLRLARLPGSADALALAHWAQTGQALAVFCATARDAQRLRDEIAWFAPDKSVHLFPDWETLPYDHFSPHHDLVSERLATLYQVSQHSCDVLIAPVSTALTRLPPREYLAGRTFFLKQGERLNLDALRAQLTLAGYSHVQQVYSPGEYCLRGGLLDLFPMGSVVPYRLDLLDEEIESIKTFDVDTQRSIYPVNEIRMLPAREFPTDEEGRATFRRNFREKFEGDPSRSRLYKDVSNGISPQGIEYYLPLYFDHTDTLPDYLPESTLVCLHGQAEAAMRQFWQDTTTRHGLLKGDRDRPLLPPTDIFVGVDEFFITLKSRARIDLQDGQDADASARPIPAVQVDRRAENPLSQFTTFQSGFAGRLLLLAESPGRRETIAALLAEHGLKPAPCENWQSFLAAREAFMLGVGPLAEGFILADENLAVITESELYAEQVRQQRRRDTRRGTTSEAMLRDLSEVRVGDPVVHEQHGVGRYQGLVSLDLGEGETEFLLLEYDGSDKLYVPVSHLSLISRYTGGPSESAPLHRLGSGQWEKARKKALKQARDTAAELLHLYAQRAARQGHAFSLKPHDYESFSAGFPFEETPDQMNAIEAIVADMTSGKPMDRLVCGDVGFGKTEVALRAAFIALMDGKQVAVLVPTTLLAEQHFQNFSDRFADFPVRIAELSRFRSAKEQNAALKGLAEGRIDLIIGTHRLIQPDVKFSNLGLIIIDEEHRFGVRQKEQLKKLRAEVDVLTLTATPIPRTLALSLEGLRDFSVIATPPQKRLAIKTFVSRFSEGLIREAVMRELKRGGQVYFLHNEVDSIHAMGEKLAKLLPEARIQVAHGQMRERDLEQVMRDFYHQRFNILLCTTIIETGIDVPSANTILINRADKFGLAQLHQLRGRVGRSHHQAYAYLLTPEEAALQGNAKKRLEAITMMEDLGAGFYLAMHDLEIRGAGEVLGESQSGEMQEVGFNLFTQMLNAAVKSLKEGKEPNIDQPLDLATEINLHTPALLPNDYCGDVHERLVLYKRLANCESQEELDLLQEELIDRFGLPPEQTRALLESHRLRLLGRPLGIAKIDASTEHIQLQFIPNPPVDAMKIIRLVQTRPGYKLAGQDKLRVTRKAPDLAARVAAVREVLKELT